VPDCDVFVYTDDAVKYRSELYNSTRKVNAGPTRVTVTGGGGIGGRFKLKVARYSGLNVAPMPFHIFVANLVRILQATLLFTTGDCAAVRRLHDQVRKVLSNSSLVHTSSSDWTTSDGSFSISSSFALHS